MCSEVAVKESWEWEEHLAQVLSTKPVEVVQEACQVLEKHGCPVKELKSELYYSSTNMAAVSYELHKHTFMLCFCKGANEWAVVISEYICTYIHVNDYFLEIFVMNL